MRKSIEMARQSLEIEANAVKDVLDKMDWVAFQKATEALSKCDKIITWRKRFLGNSRKEICSYTLLY